MSGATYNMIKKRALKVLISVIVLLLIGIIFAFSGCRSKDVEDIQEDTHSLFAKQVSISNLSILQDGYFTKIQFLITYPELDSAMLENILPTMEGYQFESIESKEHLSFLTKYEYSNTCTDLLDNQCFVTVLFANVLNLEDVSFIFKNIGFYNEFGEFVSKYEGQYQFICNNSDFDKKLYYRDFSSSVQEGMSAYYLSDLYLSEFGYEIIYTFTDRTLTVGNLQNINDIFENAYEMECFKTNGEKASFMISRFQGRIDGLFWDGTVHIRAYFDTPIRVSDLSKITMFNSEYLIDTKS